MNRYPTNSNGDPCLSDHAQRAFNSYIGDMREVDPRGLDTLTERAQRTLGVIACYAPNSFGPGAYDAAAMQYVAEHIFNENAPDSQRASLRALNKGLRGQYDSDRTGVHNAYYRGSLVSDMPTLDEQASRTVAHRLYAHNPELLSPQYTPTESDWSIRVGPDIPQLAETARTTNVESQIARAAFMLERVAHPPDDRRQQLHDILSLEANYAALLEVYGLHAFDMLAQTTSAKARLRHSGKEKLIEFASTAMTEMKQINPDDIIRVVLGEEKGSATFAVNEEHYDEAVIFQSNKYESGFLNSRYKTVGKYAMKLAHNGDYDINDPDKQLADIFGMLAVLPDARAVGENFASVASRVMRNPAVELLPAPSKDAPFYIQGTPDFVAQIQRSLPDEMTTTGMVQTKIIDTAPEHTFQVAKFTAIVHVDGKPVPTEFQFQTAADRENARVGNVSHMAMNGAKIGANDKLAMPIPGKPDDLHKLRQRKAKVEDSKQVINPHTLPRAEKLNALIRKRVA